MYIYESHMGGFFTSDEVLDYEDTYCEECGDSDTFIGCADTQEEALRLLEDEICRDYTGKEACIRCQCTDKRICDVCDRMYSTGGYDEEYVMSFIRENFEE